MFENINLKEELIKERKSEHSINSLINELNTILKDDSKLEEKIISQLSCNNESTLNSTLINKLDPQSIFDIQEIKNLAIK